MSGEGTDTGSDTTQDDASTVAELTQGTTTETTTTETNAGWMFADGKPGEGDAPEWFKSDKYATVSAQAEAYKELEGKFGSFTGSPDEFSIAVSEDLAAKGVEFDSDDPLMTEAVKFAKESNMSQDGFDKMINLYAMSQLASNDAMDQHKVDEIKSLGDNAQVRIDNITKWANANLSEEQVQGLNEMASSAESVRTIERLISMTRAAPINIDESTQAPGVSEAEVREMQFAKDEYGNRKIHTDRAFAAEFKKKSEQLWGSEDHRQVIG